MTNAPKGTGGRKATGTIHRYVPAEPGERWGHYVVRCSAPDGSRPLFHLDPSPKSKQAEERARATAAHIAEELWAKGLGAAPPRARARRPGDAPPSDGETVATWLGRWLEERELRGIASVRSDRSRLRTHVEPLLGGLRMADVRRGDVEGLVSALDDRVREGQLSWKSALNVWVLVSKAFDDACNAKSAALRVLTENPAAAVRGPDRGTHKSKTYLYPSEFLQLIGCADVPLHWRRRVALAVYLFPRAAELEALEWSDVDTDRGIIHVHRAVDRANGGVKPTKTGVTRRFAVEANVLPLLRAMQKEASAARVDADMPPEVNLARDLRVYMQRAGLKRAELYASDATRKPLGFHDLRATGLTWMAVRGDDPLKIMQRAGHREFKTTQIYIREAEAVRDGFGDVFPALPAALLSGPIAGSSVTSSATGQQKRTQVRGIVVPKVGLEPTSHC